MTTDDPAASPSAMMWQGSCTILQRPRRPPGPSSRTSRPRACAPSRSPSNLGCPRRALRRLKAVKARPVWLSAAWVPSRCRRFRAAARAAAQDSRRRRCPPDPIGCVRICKTCKARCSLDPQAVGCGAHLGSSRLAAAGLRAERRRNDPSHSFHIAARRRRGGLGPADASRWDAAVDALDQLEADAASAQATGRLSDERAAQIRTIRQRVLEDLQRIHLSSPTPGPTTTTQTTPSTETNDNGGNGCRNDGQSGKSKGDGRNGGGKHKGKKG
jgi:hypothetical protein